MIMERIVRRRRRSRGVAAVELALCLPLLLILALPIVDVARVIQANMILTNMAREGANLATRTTQQEQGIMNALAATAPPLNMAANGAIRITKILATKWNGVPKNIVIDQWRWTDGSSTLPDNGMWTCGSDGTHWQDNGKCSPTPPTSVAPAQSIMAGKLNEGDVIVVVEVFYKFPLLFQSTDFGRGAVTPSLSPDLHTMAIFDFPGGGTATAEKVDDSGSGKDWDDGDDWGGGDSGGGGGVDYNE